MELLRHPMFHTLEHKTKALSLIYLDFGRYLIILLAFQMREAAYLAQPCFQKVETRHMKFPARRLYQNRRESESHEGHHRFPAILSWPLKNRTKALTLTCS